MRPTAAHPAISGRFLYLHLYADGDLYMLPSNRRSGCFITFKRLKAVLLKVKQRHMMLLYSTEEPRPEARKKMLAVNRLILDLDLSMQMVNPHPEVYGFRHSYAPYLEQALEVAQIDVDGLRHCLADAKRALTKTPEDSEHYRERQELCEAVRCRLRNAKRALNKISKLHFDLFIEIKEKQQ